MVSIPALEPHRPGVLIGQPVLSLVSIWHQVAGINIAMSLVMHSPVLWPWHHLLPPLALDSGVVHQLEDLVVGEPASLLGERKGRSTVSRAVHAWVLMCRVRQHEGLPLCMDAQHQLGGADPGTQVVLDSLVDIELVAIINSMLAKIV